MYFYFRVLSRPDALALPAVHKELGVDFDDKVKNSQSNVLFLVFLQYVLIFCCFLIESLIYRKFIGGHLKFHKSCHEILL